MEDNPTQGEFMSKTKATILILLAAVGIITLGGFAAKKLDLFD